MKDIIAFWGYPRKELIKEAKEKYPFAQFVDLDIDYNYPKLNLTPDAYCVIIKNILNNAYYLKNRIIEILAPIGKDKCDSAFFVCEILKNEVSDKKVKSVLYKKIISYNGLVNAVTML